MEKGYRRRILIEPAPGRVTAELEDDYHRMVVTLAHEGGIVVDVAATMKRAPWTTCPGAMAALRATFTGVPLAGFAKRGERTSNCTHLHDLALFAAAHADDAAPVAYDILVTDPIDGVREARLSRDGAPLLAWRLAGDRIAAPAEIAGRTPFEIGDWIATLDRSTKEAARILRWATIVAHGRGIDMPAGMPATAFPPGNCYTFQPEQAAIGRRVPDADIDFSAPGRAPMADREAAFTPLSSSQPDR